MRVEIATGAVLPVVGDYVERMVEDLGHEVVDEHPDVVAYVAGPRTRHTIPGVRFWMGSDALALGSHPVGEPGVVNLAGTTGIQSALALRGISSQICPIVPLPFAPLTGPVSLTRILTYVPQGREALYYLDLVEQVAEALAKAGSGYEVTVLGRGEHAAPYGMLEMQEKFSSHWLLLRLTKWDGAALLVQEALRYGRAVVWNHDPGWPGVTRVTLGDYPVAAVVGAIIRARVAMTAGWARCVGPITAEGIRKQALASLRKALEEAAQ
jgi:hypothetical protein